MAIGSDKPNWAVNKIFLKSYNKPVICVGNLSVGGTGKSPMIEYLLEYLVKDYRVAVLSRGYKRRTKGFREVQVGSTL